jgi:hypothetical protein
MISDQASTGSALFDSEVRVPAHVVYRTFALETVVVNLERGVYHGLNPTAGRMLDALARCGTIRAAASSLVQELGRPFDEVAGQLTAFCSDLLERGLIEVGR